MSAGTWASVIMAGIAVLGLAWNGGQLNQVVRELRRIATDHEDRIRVLEGRGPEHGGRR
jgi:hypothetical protein